MTDTGEEYYKLVKDKFKEPLDRLVDPAILDIVLELNSAGLATAASCAGNHYSGDNYEKRGYIAFNEKLDKEDIPLVRSILSSYGVRYIKFSGPSKGKYFSDRVEFKSLGGPQPPGWRAYRRKTKALTRKLYKEGSI